MPSCRFMKIQRRECASHYRNGNNATNHKKGNVMRYINRTNGNCVEGAGQWVCLQWKRRLNKRLHLKCLPSNKGQRSPVVERPPVFSQNQRHAGTYRKRIIPCTLPWRGANGSAVVWVIVGGCGGSAWGGGRRCNGGYTPAVEPQERKCLATPARQTTRKSAMKEPRARPRQVLQRPRCPVNTTAKRTKGKATNNARRTNMR